MGKAKKEMNESEFSWLRKEVALVHTPKFFSFSGGLRPEQIERGVKKLPKDYIAFLAEFGEARMYRELSYYLVGVYDILELCSAIATRQFLNFGHFDSIRANFAFQPGIGILPGVFEDNGGDPVYTDDCFSAWLRRRCADARSHYSAKEWQSIAKGPRPFSQAELDVIDARRRISWRVVGFTRDGKVRFELINKSTRYLQWLTIGVKDKEGTFEGAVALQVADLAPGCTATIERRCYEKIASPEDLIFFSLPDPGPEDRERYREFRLKA